MRITRVIVGIQLPREALSRVPLGELVNADPLTALTKRILAVMKYAPYATHVHDLLAAKTTIGWTLCPTGDAVTARFVLVGTTVVVQGATTTGAMPTDITQAISAGVTRVRPILDVCKEEPLLDTLLRKYNMDYYGRKELHPRTYVV